MLNFGAIEKYALGKQAVVKEYPFDASTAVFKVGGKMFLLCSRTKELLQFNVKCNPLYALELRTLHKSVIPGYHMNKKHWNTIIIDGTLDDKSLYAFIDDSYELVFSKLSKKLQAQLLLI